MRSLKGEVVRSSVEGVCTEKLGITGMEEEFRKTGIDVMGDAPWGTHFCQFYGTREDLIDVLVPYFKAGLENNEFCMWVTSEPLSEEEAKEAMRRAVPDFDRYLQRGQIEIVPHTEWYLKDGVFNLQRVLNAWIDKLNQALAEGYDGIRVTGNTAWLEKGDWRDFVDYEEEVNNAIGKYRIMAICTYLLDKCRASEVIDVVRNHQFALIKRRGEWELIESSELKRAKETLKESERHYRLLFEGINDAVMVYGSQGRFLDCNEVTLQRLGYSREEFFRLTADDIVHPDFHQLMKDNLKRIWAGETIVVESAHRCKDGRVIPVEANAQRIEYKEKPAILAVVRDITERKKTEETLRLLSSVVEQSTEGIAMSDLEGNLLSVNNAFAAMHGYAPEELVGKHLSIFHTPEQMPAVKAANRQIQETGEFSGEIWHAKRDGTVFPSLMHNSLLRDEAGNPIGMIGTLRDVTVRKRTEEALRESEEKFRTIFESANDCMIYLDRSGRILDVNKKAMEVFGGSKKEVLGKHFTKVGIFSPRDIPTLMSSFAKILAGKRPTLNVRIKSKKGQETSLECSTSLTKINGKLAATLIIARDVTERKRAEEALRKSKEEYGSIVELAPDSIMTFDLKGVVTSCNTASTRLSGYSKDEIVGKHFSKVGVLRAKDIGKYLKMLPFTIRGKVPEPFEVVYRRKDGTLRLGEVHLSLIRERGKITGIQAIMRDITERKKAEEELIRLSSAVKMSTDSIVISDLDAKIIDVNEATLKMFGTDDRMDLIGKNSFDLITPEEREKAFAGTKEVLEKGFIKGREYHIITKDGGRIPVEMSVAIMKDPDGKPIGFVGISRDITERKKAEEALRDSEERYRNLVEREKDIIYTLDNKGNITFASPAVETVLGYRPEEVTGKNFMVLIPEEWQEKTAIDFNNLLKTGEITAETILLDKKEKPHFVEYSSTVIKEGNKVVGTRGIVRDITKRKKMEEALKRQRDIAITLSGAGDLIEALNRLFNNLLEMEEFDCAGFYLVDKDTRALDMIAYRDLPERFVEKVSHFDVVSPYTKVVMEGKPIYQKTSNFPPAIREDLQSDGILAVAAIPIQYEGKIIGHLNMASHTHDEISASTRHVLESVSAQIGETIIRARMEEKLRESEEKLRRYSEHLEELVQKRTEELLESEKRYSVLVEEARDGVAILQDARVVFANKRGAEIFGYSRDGLIGLLFEKLVDEKYLQLVKERYMRRLRGEEVPPTYEIALVAKSGERIPVEISATLIHYQGRPADLVLVRDIRARKKLEEERLRLEKLATIGELATMVGHDLRNPLQSIENATYYLTNELPHLPISQKATEMLEVLSDSVNYADKIIRDLHDFSATKKPVIKKTNINAIVKEVLAQVETPENVKPITKLGRLSEMKVDKEMIKRAFMNLAINGIQAMKEKGGRLKVSTKKTKGFVEVSFKDTGVGIPKEDTDKIFTPFFTTRARGMGMGLPICKKFVEAHGGSIEAESEEGKGSTFTVKLPIQQKNGGEKQ